MQGIVAGSAISSMGTELARAATAVVNSRFFHPATVLLMLVNGVVACMHWRGIDRSIQISLLITSLSLVVGMAALLAAEALVEHEHAVTLVLTPMAYREL